MEIGTRRVEGMATEQRYFHAHHLDIRDPPSATGSVRKVRTVIRQSFADPVWNCIDEVSEEVDRGTACRLGLKFNENELRRPIDCND